MAAFLQQVAQHYIDSQALEDYCFVFPNRRSGQFFTHYLQQMLVERDKSQGVVRPHLMPCVTPINDLVAEMTGTTTATDIEMMFALYDAYCQVMGDRAQEFDKFIYWGQLIVGDFNDVDRSLADTAQVYQNLKDLHDLSSNYLSEEVQEKIKQIFGDNLYDAFFDVAADAALWQRRSATGSKPEGGINDVVKQEFITLWNALEDIYHRYHQSLTEKGVVSPGRQLREAATGKLLPLHYERLVFVGFGVLSAAEVKFFDRFNDDGLADFWWDNAGLQRLLDIAPHDPGALLIDGYCKRFKAKELEQLKDKGSEIRVVSVASTVGQAKQAFTEVKAMRAGEKSMPDIETAIVLPDETLLLPLLHSVHDVGDMNVTLGYPLRNSGIVSLMHIVARMHHQASKEHGEWTYYREDVNNILSHPLIKSYFTGEALMMTARLSRTNRFNYPAAEFKDLSFSSLFEPAMDSEVKGGNINKSQYYLDNLLVFCNTLMERMLPVGGEGENNDGSEVETPLQQAFLMMYIDVLHQLKRSLAQCRQELMPGSVFYLIDRLSAAAIVPFTGQPLKGLQLMGLLETRSLDFEHVVILSMNERVFPRHRSINSFIPNYIRRAYGMSTIEQEEAVVAFNFYRLLNRSRHVSLIYDSSAQKMGSSEPSRYIAQLEKIFGKTITHVEMTPEVNTSGPIVIQVPHMAVSNLREIYNSDPVDGLLQCLSASSINKYISCPLKFYLNKIQGLNDDNNVSDFMDWSTFGTIVHDTLTDCYNSCQVIDNGGVVTRQYLEFFKKEKLEDVVVRNIKKTYLNISEKDLDADSAQLRGEPLMLVETIMTYAKYVINYDMDLIEKQGPITILECEQTHDVPKLEIGNVTFNFTYKADRIDRLANGTVRIVDYKTGADKTSFRTMDDLFDATKDKRCKAILQLLLYCGAYLKTHPELTSVMPVIYRIPSMKESGVKYCKSGQYIFSWNDEVAQVFAVRLAGVINTLFDGDFIQVDEGASACNYCRFIDYCRRTTIKK